MALVVPYINASAVNYANRQQPPAKPEVHRVQRVQPVEPKRYSSEQQEAYKALEKRAERILKEENKKRAAHSYACLRELPSGSSLFIMEKEGKWLKQEKSVGTCELCGREEVERTVHHLVPKDEGGTHGATVWLCKACHRQIHALYSNKELAVRLNTIERLRADEKIWRFIKWIRKQRGEKRVKVRRSKTKKR